MDQFRMKNTEQIKAQPQNERSAVQQFVATKNKNTTTKYIVIGLIVAVVLIVAGLFWQFVYKKDAALAGVDSSKKQALFLTNGQVYFGDLSQKDSKTIKLENIFYLQVQQDVQPKPEESKQGETQLIKLGQELHGPEDAMFVDRNQVLFWENLKDNGKVAEAIKQYKP